MAPPRLRVRISLRVVEDQRDVVRILLGASRTGRGGNVVAKAASLHRRRLTASGHLTAYSLEADVPLSALTPLEGKRRTSAMGRKRTFGRTQAECLLSHVYKHEPTARCRLRASLDAWFGRPETPPIARRWRGYCLRCPSEQKKTADFSHSDCENVRRESATGSSPSRRRAKPFSEVRFRLAPPATFPVFNLSAPGG